MLYAHAFRSPLSEARCVLPSSIYLNSTSSQPTHPPTHPKRHISRPGEVA